MGYEIFREIDLFHNNFVKFHEIFVKYKNLNQFHEMFSAIRLSKLLPIFTPFFKKSRTLWINYLVLGRS